MKAWSVFLSAALAASCVDDASPPGDPLGGVVLALAADVCQAFCAAEIRAEIYRDGQAAFPLGPAAQAECGEPLAFTSLPAGTRVRLVVEVFDEAGALRLEGESEPVTVVAGETSTARITITTPEPPTITDASPDPVVAADADGVVVITGAGLEGRGSADGVALGATTLAATWSPATSGGGWVATVPRAAPSGELVVTSCGIRSGGWPLRVVGRVVGLAPVVQPPGCGGRRVAALATAGDALLVAFACDDDGGGYVERFVEGGACPLDGEAIWELDDAPVALAPGWVGLAGGGVAAFDEGDPGAVGAREGSGIATALAMLDGRTYGIVDGALVRVDEGQRALATLDAGLELVALAAAPGAVFALADSSGDERLVEVAVPAESVAIRVIPGCEGPRALAASATHVALACEGGLVLWERVSGQRKSLDEVAAALAFDPRGDVALAWTPGARLSLVDAADATRVHAWASAPPGRDGGLVWLGQRVVAPGADAGSLVVWAPYDGGGPCP
ncbi:MAG: hypothetical protein IT385_12730 [Deltaproteobacteria bacterium]|nr:hypothetical protein [Deltaproteobacteria bacterium]